MKAIDKIKGKSDKDNDDYGDQRKTIHNLEPLPTLKMRVHYRYQYNLPKIRERRLARFSLDSQERITRQKHAEFRKKGRYKNLQRINTIFIMF